MSWSNYKHRFVPWIASNWSNRLIKEVDKEALKFKQVSSLEQLKTVLQVLVESVIDPHGFSPTPLSVKKLLRDNGRLEELHRASVNALLEVNGFSLAVRPSLLPGGGNGVFVSSGRVREGQLVALYPGTVYMPYEPLLLQSLNNSFILRCFDGIHIDGKHSSLSRLIYKYTLQRRVCGGRHPINLASARIIFIAKYQLWVTPRFLPICCYFIYERNTTSRGAVFLLHLCSEGITICTFQSLCKLFSNELVHTSRNYVQQCSARRYCPHLAKQFPHENRGCVRLGILNGPSTSRQSDPTLFDVLKE